MQAAFTTEPAFLVTAERTGRIEFVVGIRPIEAVFRLVRGKVLQGGDHYYVGIRFLA